MLYQINLPNFTQHLEWIVQFQRDLLHALCNPNHNAATVTVDWVKNQRQDIDGGWLDRFCRWEKDGKSMLERMKAVARLSRASKQAMITHYDNNLRYVEAFDDALVPPPATKPVPDNWTSRTSEAYRGFFKMFYDPIFYISKGYSINATELNGESFTKDNYLRAYRASNSDLNVCPLCDGDMNGAELDHWLAKHHLPELNCHPQNLVEICGGCNKRYKGEKLTMDRGEVEPFNNWFHPYLRPAAGNFIIEKHNTKVRLVSSDANTQERLDKLDQLIKLSMRWENEWRIQFKIVQKKISGTRRRRHGQALDSNELINKIETWKSEAEDYIGVRPHTLVEVCCLAASLDENSDEFAELFVEAVE